MSQNNNKRKEGKATKIKCIYLVAKKGDIGEGGREKGREREREKEREKDLLFYLLTFEKTKKKLKKKKF